MSNIVTPLTKIFKTGRGIQARWHVVNGKIVGQFENERQAKLAALKHDDPRVADWLDTVLMNNCHHAEYEAIERRAIKAAFLYRDGHVLSPRTLDDFGSYVNEVARVRSRTNRWDEESELVEYAICFDGHLDCECKDWENGRDKTWFPEGHPSRPVTGAPQLFNQDVACKHVLAYMCSRFIADNEAAGVYDLADQPTHQLDPHSRPVYQFNRPPFDSPTLNEFIAQVEDALHTLEMVLHEARLTQANLTFETVDQLQETLRPMEGARGEIGNFHLCLKFCRVRDDLHEAEASPEMAVA